MFAGLWRGGDDLGVVGGVLMAHPAEQVLHQGGHPLVITQRGKCVSSQRESKVRAPHIQINTAIIRPHRESVKRRVAGRNIQDQLLARWRVMRIMVTMKQYTELKLLQQDLKPLQRTECPRAVYVIMQKGFTCGHLARAHASATFAF
jgi:hypothetical protein